MTIKEALLWAAKKIKSDSAPLDAQVLLMHVLKKSKEFLYTYPEKKLTSAQLAKYKKFIARRAKHEPVAYITATKEFYGFDFLVTPDVLIPRPDTEILIEAVLSHLSSPHSHLSSPHSHLSSPHSHLSSPHSHLSSPRRRGSHPTIIDIGLGSGAIAITLKKLFPLAKVFGTEISPRAIALARKNAKRLKANIIIKKNDLLSPILSSSGLTRGSRDSHLRENDIIITANLPYISEKEWRALKPNVKKYEPKGALVGGKNGWEIYEKLFKQIAKIYSLSEKNYSLSEVEGLHMTLIIEIGHTQKPAITKLLKKYLKPKKIEAYRDLSNKWRVIKAIT